MKQTVKRAFALLLALLVLLPSASLAADHKPYSLVADEDRSPTPEGIHHYLLVCIDHWNVKPEDLKTKPGYHTDGLMLVTVDELAGRVMITSFIRDMLIVRPDGEWGRINNLFYLNGQDEKAVNALIYTINRHFDLNIEKYIMVDFSSVERIIDAVGGVDITITAREARYLQNYSISASSTTPAISGAGTYHFSGHAAVIYMRIRKVATASGATQDVGRTERDRIVMSTIADSLKDITYGDAIDLLDVIMENTIMTNMTGDDFLSAVLLALDMKGTEVEGIRMPVDDSYYLDSEAGMATQWVDTEINREELHKFLYGTSFAVID
ncbi:MAG: LCP family protein [Clostridia bacterium]|nr:LCP family protein [Clostridia bacterium]